MSSQHWLFQDDRDRFASKFEAQACALEILKGLFWRELNQLRSVKTCSDLWVAERLQFWKTDGLGTVCFAADMLLRSGRLLVSDRARFERIAHRARRKIQRLYAAGRVKEVGEKRLRAQKPEPGGDLFGGVNLEAGTA